MNFAKPHQEYMTKQLAKKAIDSLIAPIKKNPSVFITSYILMTFSFWSNVLWLLLDCLGYSPIFLCKGFDFGNLRAHLTLFCPIIYSYVICLLMAAIHGHAILKKSVGITLYLFLISLAIIELFLAYNFSLGISPQALGLLLQTNAQESSEFCTTYIFSKLTAFILFSVIFATAFSLIGSNTLCKKYLLQNTHKGLKWYKGAFALFIIGVFIHTTPHFYLIYRATQHDPKIKLRRHPSDVLSKTIYALTIFKTKDKEINEIITSITTNQHKYSSSYNSPTIVLILGESFNKHHSNLYGYHLNTSPRLTARYKNNEMFVFTDVVTPFNSTSECMKYLLSTGSSQSQEAWYKSPFSHKFFAMRIIKSFG